MQDTYSQNGKKGYFIKKKVHDSTKKRLLNSFFLLYSILSFSRNEPFISYSSFLPGHTCRKSASTKKEHSFFILFYTKKLIQKKKKEHSFHILYSFLEPTEK